MGELLNFPQQPGTMSDEQFEEAFWNETRLYEIILPGHARAEADDLGSALLAAATLVEDADPYNAFGRALRAELIITRDGRYDGLATTMAQSGQRR